MAMAKTFTSLTDPELIKMIRAGAIGIVPTDTVYGLVASATLAEALTRFYRAKPRHNEPGTIVGASVEQFEELGFQADTLKKASSYWPNAVSIVLDATNVSSQLKQHRTTLALRIPRPTDFRQLLSSTGPLMTTSANLHKQPTAISIDEAKEYFSDTVDFYVDQGPINRPASAIIEILPDHQVIVHRKSSLNLS